MRMPWRARTVAAVKAPLMVTAVACAKRWRLRLGSPAPMGKMSVPRMLVPTRTSARKMATARTRAKKRRRAEMGRMERTKMSRTSGNRRSHSYTVAAPMMRKEYMAT